MALYEDENFIAVNKPAGISSIPERDKNAPCALRALEDRLGEKLFVVHRLDKDVSGALIFAKSAYAHRLICGIFERREVVKRYIALVHGRPAPPEGDIDLPLRQFGSGRTGVDYARGKPCLTFYHTKRECRSYSLIDIRIVTGRRHQIRAHFHAIGHSIVGDCRYGDRIMQSRFPRLMLHSREISFDIKGRHVLVSAPEPELFAKTVLRAENGEFEVL